MHHGAYTRRKDHHLESVGGIVKAKSMELEMFLIEQVIRRWQLMIFFPYRINHTQIFRTKRPVTL
ncbi:hypothetical protein Hanom_Chr14g01283031 [Helianthus anomalus]